VASAGGHQDREPWLDAMLNAIEHRLTFAFLYPEQLVALVDLCTDIFTGLETHHDGWQFSAVYKTVWNVAFLSVCLFYAADVAFHSFSYSIGNTPNELHS
jgi:hypothetical protein